MAEAGLSGGIKSYAFCCRSYLASRGCDRGGGSCCCQGGKNDVGGIVSGEISWGMTVKGHYVHYSLLVAEENLYVPSDLCVSLVLTFGLLSACFC